MIATLEGVLIALVLALTPMNEGRAEPQSASSLHAKSDPSSCSRYGSDSARRSCVSRVLNAAARQHDEPYPNRIDWVAPPKHDMSQSAMLLRLPR